MGKDPDSQQPSEQILGLLGHAVKPVQQIDKHQDHQSGSEDSQLLADNRKDHIVVGLRDRSQLLDAVAQAFSEETAGTDGVQRLQRLVSCVRLVGIGVQPCLNPGDTEGGIRIRVFHCVINDSHHKDGSHRRHDDKGIIFRIYHKGHQKADAKHNHRRTHIIADFQNHDGNHCCRDHDLNKSPQVI